MVDYIAYLCVIGFPSLIIGYGSMVNGNKGATVLAYINFTAIATYFLHLGRIDGWVFGIMYILLALLVVFMYRSLFTIGGS